MSGKETPKVTKSRKDQRKISRNNDKTSNKIAINTYMSVITLNVNGPNTLIKRCRGDRIDKNKPRSTYMLPTRDSF